MSFPRSSQEEQKKTKNCFNKLILFDYEPQVIV